MDLFSGSPFFPLKDGLLASYPSLKENIACDVAIIGGGITGALVGFQLAEAGIDAVVLDRRDIGFGSTGASTSLLQYELDVPLHRLARFFGEENAVRAYRASCDALAEVAALVDDLGERCEFEWKESLCFASQPAHVERLRREFDARRKAGFAVEWWNRAIIAARSTFPYSAALLSRDAAQIDAYRFTHALLRRARERGLRVFDRTEVHGWRKRGRAFQLTIAGGHHVRARAIVIAAGYEAQRYVSRRLTAMHSTYAIVSKPLESFPGWPERALVWETARPYNYLRTTADNRAIIGGFDVPFRDPAQRDALLPAKARALERKFRRLLPKIDFERAYAWTGTFAETKDGLPFIGPSVDEPAVLFALGYGGNGITFGVIAAEIVRDRILERPNASAPLFSFDRQRLRA